MLPTPPPRRPASARNVSAGSPASSRRATASLSTASIECEARRRSAPPRRADGVGRAGRGMTSITAQVAVRSNMVLFYRTTFDHRMVFEHPTRRRCSMLTTDPVQPIASAPRTYPSLRAAWVPLAALCLAFFVEMVDNTLLAIALPTIGRDLGGSTTALQWVTGAYSLTFGGLLLTAGSAADRLGRRRVLLVGLATFGILSLAVAAVSTTGQLIT